MNQFFKVQAIIKIGKQSLDETDMVPAG